jgi:glycosyltransferase involved in cell wall biosynthesis
MADIWAVRDGKASMAVRILHLHSSFNLGGQEARTVRLMNHFGDQAEHTVLSAMPDAFGARDAIDKRIKVAFPMDEAPSLAGMPSMGRYRQLARYMKKFHLVLSYNWGSMDGVMAHTLLSRSMGLPPLIHHEDGFNHDEIDRLKKRRNWFRTIALQRANALVVPSRTLETIARTVWHQPLDKICRFPNGIDTEHYNRRPQRGSFLGFQKRKGEIVVGTIAGLRTVKNLPRLVRAVAAAGPNVRLAIAGDGPERKNIMAEAQRLDFCAIRRAISACSTFLLCRLTASNIPFRWLRRWSAAYLWLQPTLAMCVISLPKKTALSSWRATMRPGWLTRLRSLPMMPYCATASVWPTAILLARNMMKARCLPAIASYMVLR